MAFSVSSSVKNGFVKIACQEKGVVLSGGGDKNPKTKSNKQKSNAVLGTVPNSMIPSPPTVFPKQQVRMEICSFPFTLAFVKPDLPI